MSRCQSHNCTNVGTCDQKLWICSRQTREQTRRQKQQDNSHRMFDNNHKLPGDSSRKKKYLVSIKFFRHNLGLCGRFTLFGNTRGRGSYGVNIYCGVLWFTWDFTQELPWLNSIRDCCEKQEGQWRPRQCSRCTAARKWQLPKSTCSTS